LIEFPAVADGANMEWKVMTSAVARENSAQTSGQTAPPNSDDTEREELHGAAIPVPATDKFIIYIRFWADGRVWEISECPPEMTKEEWFKHLCAKVGDKYNARAGGRAFFRLSRLELEALKASTLH
jgi:hypothetical protein